jgi:alcohol dehydrogenase (cytochrome c)
MLVNTVAADLYGPIERMLDAASGKPVWNFRTGQPMSASPISYSVNGEQFVAVASGNLLFSFALPKKN